MILLQKGCNTAIYTESTAFPGVVDIAKKVAKDICLVTDFEPKVLTTDCLENGILQLLWETALFWTDLRQNTSWI